MAKSIHVKRGTHRKSSSLYSESDKHAIIESSVHPSADALVLVIVDDLLGLSYSICLDP
jgi:hypothetical protein